MATGPEGHMTGMMKTIELTISELDYWNHDLHYMLTDQDGFYGIHRQRLTPSGIPQPWNVPDNEYWLILKMLDMMYAYCYDDLNGYTKAVQIVESKKNQLPHVL